MFRSTVAALVVLAGGASADTIAPLPVSPSNLSIILTEAGQFASPGRNNFASPVAIGDDLYFVKQRGELLRETPTGCDTLIDIDTRPEGITGTERAVILNVAGTADHIFVAFTSDTLPDDLASAAPLPTGAEYAPDDVMYQVIVRYDRAAAGSLVANSDVTLTAFEGGHQGHSGGGMLVLPNGDVAFARGDLLLPGSDGLTAPQDGTSWSSRLVLIDPVTGATEVAAQGIRNVQRLTFTDATQTEIAFVDIGGTVAEEVNVISVADLVDTTTIENFGWGRAGDGFAREGTFYINADGSVSADAPVPEAGFLQPYAQFGREDATWFAGTGPVASDVSFTSIDLLFGDLNTGRLLATMAPTGSSLNEVFEVNLVDENGVQYALSTLLDAAGVTRADLRFFNFADGGAGVLLERTGRYYRISQYMAAVPLPAALWLSLAALAALVRIRKHP